jgi:L-arabinokinase
MGLNIIRGLRGERLECLAELTPAEFEERYRDRLPEEMTGAAFLDRFGELPDEVSVVDPGRVYAVRQPAAHPVHENFRVREFARLLAGDPEENAPSLGELMYGSHASYSACGLGSAGTDLLVDLVREAGTASGLYGAKITGGGSGGTVAVLGDRDAGTAVQQVAEAYRARTGYRPVIFDGSSDGAEIDLLPLKDG